MHVLECSGVFQNGLNLNTDLALHVRSHEWIRAECSTDGDGLVVSSPEMDSMNLERPTDAICRRRNVALELVEKHR